MWTTLLIVRSAAVALMLTVPPYTAEQIIEFQAQQSEQDATVNVRLVGEEGGFVGHWNIDCSKLGLGASVDDDLRLLKQQLAGFQQNVSLKFERLETVARETLANNESCSTTVGDDVRSVKDQLASFQCNISEKLQNLNTTVHQTAWERDQYQIRALRENCIPLLIQQNINGGSRFFRRSWAEYKVGFNDSGTGDGSYWIGNEILYQITNSRSRSIRVPSFRLRIDLQGACTGCPWHWAEYSEFAVDGEETGYKLHVSGFTGSTGSDAMAHHNGMKFTTFDRDNDYNLLGNCGARSLHGGFWFRNCYRCCLTCRSSNFEWAGLTGGRQQLKSSRMWLTCPEHAN